MGNKVRVRTSFFGWLRRKIRSRFMRRRVQWRQFKEKNFVVRSEELNIDTQRISDLFFALLKNKNSSLNYSPESKTRFITSDFAWACLYESKDDKYKYILRIIDESIDDNPHSHEFILSLEVANKMGDIFDEELEKRFRQLELSKEKILASEIERLIIKAKSL